jgi:hypothetical protein
MGVAAIVMLTRISPEAALICVNDFAPIRRGFLLHGSDKVLHNFGSDFPVRPTRIA